MVGTNVDGTLKITNVPGRAAVRVDGRLLRLTRKVLSEEMSEPALAHVQDQVERVLGTIVAAYESRFGAGEVGPKGTGVAARRAATKCPTGLLYGLIQSGKTRAMLLLTAMGLDNGFKVVVVLTSDNVSLVEQTADDFKKIPNVNVRDSSRIGSWTNDVAHLSEAMAESGLVLVTSKNSAHLERFAEFLEQLRAFDYPALILDDEADQATLDTFTAKRSASAKKGGAVVEASTINRLITSSDDGLRSLLKHHVFVQVTATPYALLLQRLDSNLRPDFTETLEPGEGYMGNAFFFGGEIRVDRPLDPPLVTVAAEEAAEIESGRAAPDGLRAALAYFLVASAAQGLADEKYAMREQNFLCHVSTKRNDHAKASELIQRYLTEALVSIRKYVDGGPFGADLVRAREELARTVDDPPALPDVVAYVRQRLVDREIKTVNSDADKAQFSKKLNFIVGGNILGRGLAIKNLLVTYYVRTAKTAQMDTMLQHARMFGYRGDAQQFLRVFLPQHQAVRFRAIFKAETELREFLKDNPTTVVPVPVDLSARMTATRSAVLDPNFVDAYLPGQHLYPVAPLHTDKKSREKHAAALARVSKLFPGGQFTQTGTDRMIDITIEDVIEALDYLPYEDVEGSRWSPRHARKLLDAMRKSFGDRAWLYARDAARKSISEGMAGGDELRKLRAAGRPVLCVYRDRRDTTGPALRFQLKKHVDVDFMYVFPELVFPKQMTPHFFTTDGE